MSPKTQTPPTAKPLDAAPWSEILGEKIAQDIFAIGSSPEPCSRIQFMAGDYNTKERGQGGLCEKALAKAITESLRVHMGA